MVFDKDAIDGLVKNRLGITKQKDAADLLDVRESVWSEYRNGKRGLPGPFIAVLVDVFPGVPLQSYTRSVPASALGKS
jgi:predicted transcriptional regulator